MTGIKEPNEGMYGYNNDPCCVLMVRLLRKQPKLCHTIVEYDFHDAEKEGSGEVLTSNECSTVVKRAPIKQIKNSNTSVSGSEGPGRITTSALEARGRYITCIVVGDLMQDMVWQYECNDECLVWLSPSRITTCTILSWQDLGRLLDDCNILTICTNSIVNCFFRPRIRPSQRHKDGSCW